MYGHKGNWLVLFSFKSGCFLRWSWGKHQDSRENKSNCFPQDHVLGVYFLPHLVLVLSSVLDVPQSRRKVMYFLLVFFQIAKTCFNSLSKKVSGSLEATTTAIRSDTWFNHLISLNNDCISMQFSLTSRALVSLNLSLPNLIIVVILLTVCQTILVMLVLRIWYWIPLLDIVVVLYGEFLSWSWSLMEVKGLKIVSLLVCFISNETFNFFCSL